MKKSIVFVIIIILLLGALGFGGYKYMELKEDNEDMQKMLDKPATTTTTNDYSVFVSKMKESREKLFKSDTLTVDFSESLKTYADNKEYYINLTGEGVLQLRIGDKTTEVSKDVLLYRVVYLGNGAFKSLFYVKEDGFVYTANVEEVVYEQAKLESIKQKTAKDIVAIIPGGSGEKYKDSEGKIQEAPGAAHPFFVDINGNIYPYEYSE